MAWFSNDDVAEQRRYLLRFAQLHLRDNARAEDVVQETLAAALERASGIPAAPACAPGSPESSSTRSSTSFAPDGAKRP